MHVLNQSAKTVKCALRHDITGKGVSDVWGRSGVRRESFNAPLPQFRFCGHEALLLTLGVHRSRLLEIF